MPRSDLQYICENRDDLRVGLRDLGYRFGNWESGIGSFSSWPPIAVLLQCYMWTASRGRLASRASLRF